MTSLLVLSKGGPLSGPSLALLYEAAASCSIECGSIYSRRLFAASYLYRVEAWVRLLIFTCAPDPFGKIRYDGD